MNGRVYDPFLARMISADPTVPGPFNGQAFNRYAYVFNNPLSLVDPSGFGPLGICGGTPRCAPNADGGFGGTDRDRISGVDRGCNDKGCEPKHWEFDPDREGNGARGFSGTRFLNTSFVELGRAREFEALVRAALAGAPDGVAVAALLLQLKDATFLVYIVATLNLEGEIEYGYMSASEFYEGSDAETYLGIGHTNTAAPTPSEHALVLVVDLATSEVFGTRAGPEDGLLTARSFALGDARLLDMPDQIHTLQFVGLTELSYSSVTNTAVQFAAFINASQIQYGYWTNNSNSYAFMFPVFLGFPRPVSVVISWGADACVGC